MFLERIIKKFENHPKKLFKIDLFGAILSAFLLGVVLVRFETIFGIPAKTLYFLALLPLFFAIYDYYCCHKENNRLGPFLKAIAIINLLYCCLSIGLSFYHLETITYLGWIYILTEILIIVILAIIEFKVAYKLNRNNDAN